jgi:hypothetical protein
MKKLIVIALLLSGTYSFGQTINDVHIKDIDVEFVQIVGTGRVFTRKVTVNIDFGQEKNLWNDKADDLRDENGKKIEFNSMVDALNFMTKNGYTFVDSHALALGGQNSFYFLLQKNKKPESK